MTKSVKINFRLTQDADGNPPVAVESLWAKPNANDDTFIIDNVPFFSRDATLGDTIQVCRDDDGLWYKSLINRSKNSLIRVVFFDRSCVDEVRDKLILFGCSTEFMKDYNLLAVNIPNALILNDVKKYLDTGFGAGKIDYEEPILRD